MSRSKSVFVKRLAAVVGGSAIVLAAGALAPSAASAAPTTPPAPLGPTVLFQENFENGGGSDVIGLKDYEGATGTTYDADPFWLSAAACNGLVLSKGATWSGDAAACSTQASRDKLEVLAGVLGGGQTTNHVVAAYTDKSGPEDETLLVKSENSGITIAKNKFYVASIDVAEVNCYAPTDSTIVFGLQLPSGEVKMGGAPGVACKTGNTTTVDGDEIKYGTFYSAGFKSPESGKAEYVARNLATDGSGNDFAYDNLRFYDATPSLYKSFSADKVEVGKPLTMTLTVVNTSELSEKTGWSFTDTLPEGMTVASAPKKSTDCAAADVTATAGAGVVTVANGSLAGGKASCTISVDVVLTKGGDFTNTISNVDGLNGQPSATVRALVPSMSLVKTVTPAAVTADNREATYTFTVTNDGDVDLRDVKVADPGPIGGTGKMGPIDCGGVTTLAVGAKLTCTAVYTAGLGDLDGTALKNEAKATGVSPAGTQVGADASAELPTVTPKPELTLVKSSDTAIATKAGQVITYSFTVTNTGNVNVSDVTIAEGSFSGAGKLGAVTCPVDAALLAPAATVTCTAPYTVLTADLTGKALTNTASATGVGPNGPVVSAASTAEVKTPAPGSLATTGRDAVLPLAAGALAMLLIGGFVIAAARRRHKQLS